MPRSLALTRSCHTPRCEVKFCDILATGRFWHSFGSLARERGFLMKLFSNETELNAKTRMTFALCTVLALSAASVRADDDKEQGGTGAAVKTQTGHASQLSSSDEKFIHQAGHGGKMEVK